MNNKNKGNKKTRYLVLYTAVIILLFVALFTLNQATKNKSGNNEMALEAPPTVSQPVIGNESSNVSIVEFGDYKCPSCKVWGEKIWPQLKQEYIDSGKVKFSYVNVLFHGAESQLGAQAGEAIYRSNPADFWNFHTALFDAQPQANHDEVWLTEDKLLEVVKESVPDIDVNQFQQNLKSSEVQSLVDQDSQLVKQFNVTKTPTIMINNIVITNPFDYSSIKSAIEQQLE